MIHRIFVSIKRSDGVSGIQFLGTFCIGFDYLENTVKPSFGETIIAIGIPNLIHNIMPLHLSSPGHSLKKTAIDGDHIDGCPESSIF